MKRIVFIGQAPPKTDPDKPFGRTKLYSWFEIIGISNFEIYDLKDKWDSIFKAQFNNEEIIIGFSAIYNKFPGSNKSGHLAPTSEQIKGSMTYLKNYFETFKPDLVIPIGKLSIQYCLDNFELNLNETVGKEFKTKPYNLFKTTSIIPLPHPSGASTWFYKEENAILLNKALTLIKEKLI